MRSPKNPPDLSVGNVKPQEKQAECERICGAVYSKGSGLHSAAPKMCPIQEDLWKNPKRKKEYGI